MKNSKIYMKNKWEDVTLGEFIQIEQITKSDTDDNFKVMNVIAVLSGLTYDDIKNLPAAQLTKLSKDAEFISTDVPDINKQKEYVINGTTYVLKADIPEITTAQYIDYQAIMKRQPIELDRLVAVFLIPKGHNYNEGYDFNKVVEDVNSMRFVDAQAIAFFLRRQLSLFIVILTDYLKKNLKTMKVNRKSRNTLVTQLRNMALSLWC